MKTLALANGDLVVGSAGHATVSGSAKIRQDLALALGEPYGDDRFHPTWGSVLPEYVGRALSPQTTAMVRAEVARVIDQYIAMRDSIISGDYLIGARSSFDTSDVVSEVRAISVSQFYDSLRVAVTLLTLAGTQVTIQRTVSG